MTQLFLRSKNVKLDIYTECKYTASEEVLTNPLEWNYQFCTGFEVVKGEAARQIEAESDGTCIDDYHEYLVLFFEDGTTATFRNSYVDLFAI